MNRFNNSIISGWDFKVNKNPVLIGCFNLSILNEFLTSFTDSISESCNQDRIKKSCSLRCLKKKHSFFAVQVSYDNFFK